MAIRYLDEEPVRTTKKIRYLDDVPDNNISQKPTTKPSFRTEVIGPITNSLSTLAFGIPKAAMEYQVNRGTPGAKQAFDFLYPEQQTLPGKALRMGGEIAGFVGGGVGKAATKAGKFIPKLAKEGMTRKVGRAAIEGATAGALAPQKAENFFDIKKRGKDAGFGAVSSMMFPAIGGIVKKGDRVISSLSGVKSDVYDDVAEKGFRNVLQKKYYDKKLPQKLQERIEGNIDALKEAAESQYDDLIEPLRNQPFDMVRLRESVKKISEAVKNNPFKTDVARMDKAILKGVMNKANPRNLGEALQLRRNLDDIIYNNRGELKSTFGKKVRDLIKKELHQNKDLAKVDKEWSSLQSALREGRKVTSETGENFLKRWARLPEKQKQLLVTLEKKIGGEPFVEDITNWSLAQNFITDSLPFSIPGVARSMSKPVLRGYLRNKELTGNMFNPIFGGGKGRLMAVQGASNIND